MNDLRHAIRRLRSTPVVTISAIACLSIGVWMTCIVAAIGRGVYRPDLNTSDPHEIVQIEEVGLYSIGRSFRCSGRCVSKAVFDSLAARKVFAAIGEYERRALFIQGEHRSRTTVGLSSGMMQVLRADVALGRGFLPEDDVRGRAVMISHELWRSLYGSDSTVIGRQMRFMYDAAGATIVGVMRSGFRFPQDWERPDIYISAGARAHAFPNRHVLARLRPGVSIEAASAIARDIAVRHLQSDRDAYALAWRSSMNRNQPLSLPNGPVKVRLERYHREPMHPVESGFIVLILACGLAVVAIATANVANLVLIRGASRRQEIAVRMALGASRLRVVSQLVTETAVLAAIGIVMGFTIAFWQWKLIDSGFESRHVLGTVDIRSAGIAIATGFALTLTVGVWPGLRASSMTLDQVLRDTRRSGIGSSPLDGILGRMVAASTAATVTLLICAVLLGLSARKQARRMEGPSGNVLVSALTLDATQSPRRRVEVAGAALARARGLPGVDRAALAVSGGMPTLLIAREGAEERRVRDVEVQSVSDGYFDTMSSRVREGREFLPRETHDSTGAVILGHSLAKTIFGDRSAIGERFRYRAEADPASVTATVVGVVEDAAFTGVTRLQMYKAYGSSAGAQPSALLRYASDATPQPRSIAPALRLVPGVLAGDAISTAEQQRQASKGLYYIRLAFTLFAVVGLVLAVVGTYGIVAYSVQRRTHEIGVRMALGAQRNRVVWMIVEHGLKLTLIGIIGGLILSFGATTMLTAVFDTVKLDQALAVGGVVALVCSVSIVACYIPGRRAGNLNPVDALRAE